MTSYRSYLMCNKKKIIWSFTVQFYYILYWQLLYELDLSRFIIEILWVPSHPDIKGIKETADSIAKSTSSLCSPSPTLIPMTDFCPLLRTYVSKMWLNQWINLPPSYASWYKHISPTFLSQPWFYNLKTNRNTFITFSRLRFGYSYHTHINLLSTFLLNACYTKTMYQFVTSLPWFG